MKVFLTRKARKALDASPAEIRKRLEEKTSELFETPFL